jgi:hypothetical protein
MRLMKVVPASSVTQFVNIQYCVAWRRAIVGLAHRSGSVGHKPLGY